MAMNQRQFWFEVNEKIEELQKLASAGSLPDQPGPGIVFLTSVDNKDKGIKPGVVLEVPIGEKDKPFGCAAMRIVEQTHRLATAGEVAEFKVQSKAQRERVIRKETERRKRHASTVIEYVGAAATGEPAPTPPAMPVGPISILHQEQ